MYVPRYCEPNPQKEAYHKRGVYDVKEIAKWIRKDLKKSYKDIKISTTISRYSGGQSIDCRIKKIPKKYLKSTSDLLYEIDNMYNERSYDDWQQDTYNHFYKMIKDIDNNKQDVYEIHTFFIKDNVLKDLERIHFKYNYDDSDPMVDYFDRGYYGTVEVDHHGVEIVF